MAKRVKTPKPHDSASMRALEQRVAKCEQALVNLLAMLPLEQPNDAKLKELAKRLESSTTDLQRAEDQYVNP